MHDWRDDRQTWYVKAKQYRHCPLASTFPYKKHLKNVGPIRHNEPPHANLPDVTSGTIARRLRIDVNDNDDNDNDDNAWQRGPLWPHGMGPIIQGEGLSWPQWLETYTVKNICIATDTLWWVFLPYCNGIGSEYICVWNNEALAHTLQYWLSLSMHREVKILSSKLHYHKISHDRYMIIKHSFKQEFWQL